MIIYFVRHGDPDYANDSLTELGHKQAAAAAQRLADSGITEIYASSCGRALLTAEYTATQLGLSVTPLDFMREIRWGSVSGEPILENGHPWFAAIALAAQGKKINNPNWQEDEPFSKSYIIEEAERVVTGFDGWLTRFGYTREGEYYRVTGTVTDKTIALFSHGGSSSVVLSHLLNIPLPQICGIFHPEVTGITAFVLPDEPGQLIYPRILFLNDAEHIKSL